MSKLLLIALLTQVPLLPQTDGGSIGGRITSTDGKAAAGVRVAAMADAEPNAGASGSVLAGISQTDASGNYRLENVSPGRYYITAGFVNAPTYFPSSSTRAGATVVTITRRRDCCMRHLPRAELAQSSIPRERSHKKYR